MCESWVMSSFLYMFNILGLQPNWSLRFQLTSEFMLWHSVQCQHFVCVRSYCWIASFVMISNREHHKALLGGSALQTGYAAFSCRHKLVAKMADQPTTSRQYGQSVSDTKFCVCCLSLDFCNNYIISEPNIFIVNIRMPLAVISVVNYFWSSPSPS